MKNRTPTFPTETRGTTGNADITRTYSNPPALPHEVLQDALNAARNNEVTSVALVIGGPRGFLTDFSGHYVELSAASSLLNSKNIFEEGELSEESTIRNFRIVQTELITDGKKNSFAFAK